MESRSLFMVTSILMCLSKSLLVSLNLLALYSLNTASCRFTPRNFVSLHASNSFDSFRAFSKKKRRGSSDVKRCPVGKRKKKKETCIDSCFSRIRSWSSPLSRLLRRWARARGASGSDPPPPEEVGGEEILSPSQILEEEKLPVYKRNDEEEGNKGT